MDRVVDLGQLDILLVLVVLVLDQLPREVGASPALVHEWAIVGHVFRSCPVFGSVLLDCLFILREEKREGHQELEVWDLPL